MIFSALRVCYFLVMARLPRVVAVDTPHHVTQRGNARQVILATDADRLIYLELLRDFRWVQEFRGGRAVRVSVAGFRRPRVFRQKLKEIQGRPGYRN